MRFCKDILPAAVAALAFHDTPALATSIDMAWAMYVEPTTMVVGEGNGDGELKQIIFTVNLGYGDIVRPQSVGYEVVPGTAMPTEDYKPIPNGTLVFDVSERSKPVVVTLVGDRIPECSEHFFLRLSRGGVWVLDAIATIQDDDVDDLDGGIAPTCTPHDLADGGVEDPPDARAGDFQPPSVTDSATNETTNTTDARSAQTSSSGCSIARSEKSGLTILMLSLLGIWISNISSRRR